MVITTSFLVIVADLALAILGIEVMVLFWTLYRAGIPPSEHDRSRKTFLLTTLSGFGLLFALRSALVQADHALVLAGLSLGGLAHLLDLVVRTRAGR